MPLPLVTVALLLVVAAGCRTPEPPAQTVSPPAKPAAKPAAPPGRGPKVATITHAGKRFTVCTVDLSRHRLDLFWRDGKGQPFGSFDRLSQWLRGKGRELTFAMNAGMFREDLSPVGLYVEHGKELRPLNLSRGSGNFCLRPNGVFALTRSGARVIESSRYPQIRKSTTLATQSGPMLVIDKRLHPKFSAGSTSRLIRNGVGVVSAQQVVFAIAEDPVNFHEFALLFRDGLHCDNALYFDGSVSALYAPALNRDDGLGELGPMIGVTEALR